MDYIKRVLSLLIFFTFLLTAQSYESQWTEIKNFENKRLPKSALAVVEDIYKQAKRDGESSQVIKALIYREKYSTILKEDGYVKSIKNLEKELENFQNEGNKKILKSILAQMYTSYLSRNIYRLQSRTKVNDNNSTNILLWSPDKLISRSSALYLESLEGSGNSDKIEIYKDILLPDNNSNGLRPTLYDFLTFRALAHFSDKLNGLTKPDYNFYIDKKEAFASINTFVNYEFRKDDTRSFMYQSLIIYQKLLRFHQERKDQKALNYVNFHRLNFVYKNYVGEERDEYYLQALNSLESQHIHSEALYYLADYYSKKNSFVKAMGYAKKGIKSPDKYISSKCKAIKKSMEVESLRFNIESVNLPNDNILARVAYRNIEQIFVKVIKLSEEEHKEYHFMRGRRDAFLRGLKSFRDFNITLSKTEDYQNHSTEISLGNYDYGHYAFLLSTDSSFNHQLVHNLSTVSKIAHFYRKGKVMIVDRADGKPIEGVEVSFLDSKGKLKRSRKSNKDGVVKFPKKEESYTLHLKKGKDSLYFVRDSYYSYRDSKYKPKDSQRVYFFTDRAIYRPAQTIYFKGLAVKRFPKKRPEILANREIEITLLNGNSQKIEMKKFKTDEFGTLNGSFVLPKNGKNGSVRLSSNIGGSKTVNVEEYKRPKFELEFSKLDKSYRLGDKVTVKGKAKAYAGNGISEAKVKYRVTRETSFPWIGWWRARPLSPPIQIAMGEVKTDSNGEFAIDFDALIDKSLSGEDKPNFSYRVTVDVTDSTGETQSDSKIVNLGFVAVKVDMVIDGTIEKNSTKTLILNTTNLDGNFEALKGKIVIERLKDKSRVYRNRYWGGVDKPIYNKEQFNKLFPNYEYKSQREEIDKKVQEHKFDTAKSKLLTLDSLEQGEYLITLHTVDRYGTEVEKSKKILVYDKSAKRPASQTYLWQKLDKKEYEIDSTATISMKSSSTINALISIERDGKVKERWIEVGELKKELVRISKKDRGDIFYRIVFVKDNRQYSEEGKIKVPWNSKLKVEYISFRDKLKPNMKEQWKIKISGKDKNAVLSQMVATAYDASLDQFIKHHFWFPNLYPVGRVHYNNRWTAKHFNDVSRSRYWKNGRDKIDHRVFYKLNWFGLTHSTQGRMYEPVMAYMTAAPAPEREARGNYIENIAEVSSAVTYSDPYESGMGGAVVSETVDMMIGEAGTKSAIVPKPIRIRKDMQETMFFKPNLQTDKDGNIIIDFKTNDALTKWNFLGFAHTKDMRTATTKKEFVTQKDLMVVTNLPRFFREEDKITLSAKVVNMSDRDLNGTCELELVRPEDEKNIYGDHNFSKPFFIKKGEGAVVEFKIKIPSVNLVSAIKHTIIAKTNTHSDAEQTIKPILSNRMFVTQSKALSIKGNESRTITLKSLKKNSSSTLKHHKLTLEFSSNPVWYAIKSLPYLMEYPHECSEQLFNRYFANSLASKIANHSPKIKQIFDSWRDKKELKSALNSNQELKSILLEETPWVLESQSQEQQQKNIALLFDLNKLAKQRDSIYTKLFKRQKSDGGWAWFTGGESNWYITQYIVEGFGKLKELGVDKTRTEIMGMATHFMDVKMLEQYRSLEKMVEKDYAKFEDDHLNSMIIHYLYARSFYGFKINPEAKKAHDYYLEQAKKYWTKKGLYEEAMIALTLNRKGDKKTAQTVAESLKERALVDDERGMYFKYNSGYHWNQMPIETHVMIMDVFDTVAKDKKSVELLKIWLLKNKQTTHWKTTKATASAIYALLKDDRWLSNDKLVHVSFDTKIEYQPILKSAKKSAQKGTGYFKASFSKFDSDMATVHIKNPNSNIAWGGLYWQYFENLNNIKSFKETPLTIDKKLFLVKYSKTGKELVDIDNSVLKVGDKLQVRIEIVVDRDMEYIMLKDSRASAFEPIDVLSQYKWQDGLGYYQSTKDNATYFFIDYLKRGTYVFEYPLFVTHKGKFSNGITTIESMYAPEFKSHSKGGQIYVQ